MCNHPICQALKCMEKVHSSVAVIVKVNGKIVLGLERWGERKDMFGMCMGKMEPCDQFCWLRCAVRELYEEFRINLNVQKFEAMRPEWGTYNRLPIFLITYDNLNFDECQKNVLEDYLSGKESCYTEMIHLALCPITEFKKVKYMRDERIHIFTYNTVRYFLNIFN